MSTASVAAPTACVGLPAERVDAAEKLRGEAEYAGDIDLPGLVAGAVLRSSAAHARIRSIDASAAEALPGVVCVLTAADLRDLDPYWGHRIRDRPVLAIDKVHYPGDPVAAVAAVDEPTAFAALELIAVDYEELPVVGTLDDALAPGAQLVHEEPLRPGLIDGGSPVADGNACYRYESVRGEPQSAFAHADFLVEREYRFPALYQYAMETHTVVARWTPREIELWSSCQHPFLVRSEIAALFEVPLDRVRLVVPYVGGGFGSKSYTKMEPIAVALARKAGRPVRLRNSVSDSMLTNRRHGMRCRMRTAMNREGRLLGREVECWFDTGAYADNGPRVAAVGGELGGGPYRWLGLRCVSSCVYTNTVPAGSYRAFGAIHVQWIGEAQIDELARQAGLDPVAVRLQNLCRPGEQVKSSPGKPLDADLVGDLELLADALRRDGPARPGRGRGVSVGLITAGAQPASAAIVRLAADARASVFVGTTEIGQGARTAFAQIAAEELSLPLESVTVHGADTRFTPYDRSTGASRSTTVAGLAVQQAAADVRAQLERLAGGPVEPGDYPRLIGRRFGLAGGGELIGRGDTGPHDAFDEQTPLFWEVCMAGVEVEVDRETGFVRLPRLVTIADVGKAINPQLVERQDEGAALQGIGNALFEELVFEDGHLLNDTLLDYRVPTCADVPDSLECILVENGDGPGPYGAKGCGEGAFAAVPSAIVNALADAGVTGLTELPLTPERVWRRVRELEEEHA